MIWLVIMLFMIGQALNMGTAYWVIWGIYIFCQVVSATVEVCKKILKEKD